MPALGAGAVAEDAVLREPKDGAGLCGEAVEVALPLIAVLRRKGVWDARTCAVACCMVVLASFRSRKLASS